MDNISAAQPIINKPLNPNINNLPKSDKFAKLKFYLKKFKLPIWLQVVIIVILVLGFAITTIIFVFANKNNNLSTINITPTPTLELTLTPTPIEEPVPTFTLTPTSTSSPKPTTITPTPTRQLNPPIYKIDYPTELQNIELGEGENFCIADTPNGGDQSGIQRRHLINDLVWTTYTQPFTLCFEPKEGLNRIYLQYKNQSGDESPIYTRQFNFHRVANIATVISGQVFADSNCNGTRDADESEIKANVNLRFLKMPDNIVDGSLTTGIAGAFSYTKNLAESASVDIRIVPDNNSYYQTNPKITYPTVTLNKNSTSVQINIPMVPIENLSACN